METGEKLLKYLEVISQRVTHHHDSLWEEEKHYSWWVYVILAGLIFVYMSRSPYLCGWPKVLIIVVGCGLGIYLSRAGYKVIRKESQYFHEARESYRRTLIALDLDSRRLSILPPSDKKTKDWSSVKSEANKSLCELVSVFKWSKWKRVVTSFSKRKRLSKRMKYWLLVTTLVRCRNKKCKLRIEKYERGIRDFFQLTFFITKLLFISLLLFSLVTLLLHN